MGHLKTKKIIVQGLGNVGYYAAKFLSTEDHAKVVGVVEYDGAIYDADGIDIDALKQHQIKTGSIKGFDKGKFYENGQAVFTMECDILIPAATENVIAEENASDIKSKSDNRSCQWSYKLRCRQNPTRKRHPYIARPLGK